MNQDRYGVTIRGEHIRHSVASRDWFCECGCRVVTLYFEEEPHWRSVCSCDANHDVDGFVHTRAVPYVQSRLAEEEERAKEVLDHLPPQLRAVINERGKDAD